jgi:hypothetical protein
MTVIRTLATFCATLVAALTLAFGSAKVTPAAAQAAAEAPLPVQTRPGRPLNLLPHFGKTKKVAKSKTAHRVGQRRARSHVFARRRNAPAVASHEDTASTVAPNQGSLGYQAEGSDSKTQPPVDAWLRSPLPAQAATARPPVATAAVTPVVRPNAPMAAPADDTAAAGTSVADTIVPPAASTDLPVADTDSTADNVQVADASEINEIDLAANDTRTNTPTNGHWLGNLLTVLGGAFAAAATAGFLFGRRRQSKFGGAFS